MLAIPAALLVSIILARTLGPNDYGTYTFALSLINLFALMLTGGISQLVTREVAFALHEHDRGLIKGVILSSTAWGLMSSALAILVIWGALTFFGSSADSMMRVLLLTGSAALPILALAPVWAGTLRGHGLGAKSQFPGLLLMPLTQLVTVTVLISLDILVVRTAMIAFVLSNSVVALVGLYLMKKTVSDTLRSAVATYRLSRWSKSSAIFTGIALITYLNTQIGVLLLGLTSSKADVAAFQIADRAAQFVILTIAIIELVLAPHVARHHKARQHERLQGLFSISRRIGAAITFVVALPMIFYGATIIRLLFGEIYVETVVQPLAIISIALVVRALFGPTSTFLSMTGNERSTLAALGLALLVNVILTLILAPKMGATGAGWASAAGIVTWSLLLGHQTQRKLDIPILRI